MVQSDKEHRDKSALQTIIASISTVILSAVLLWIGSTLNEIKVNTAVMATKIDYVVLSVQENRTRIEVLERGE